MDTPTLIVTVTVCLFGSGGVVIWILNHYAKKAARKDENTTALKDISERLGVLQDGLVMTLENDRVIFSALRTHEINGESEEQEKKMDRYFISLLDSQSRRNTQ